MQFQGVSDGCCLGEPTVDIDVKYSFSTECISNRFGQLLCNNHHSYSWCSSLLGQFQGCIFCLYCAVSTVVKENHASGKEAAQQMSLPHTFCNAESLCYTLKCTAHDAGKLPLGFFQLGFHGSPLLPVPCALGCPVPWQADELLCMSPPLQ